MASRQALGRLARREQAFRRGISSNWQSSSSSSSASASAAAAAAGRWRPPQAGVALRTSLARISSHYASVMPDLSFRGSLQLKSGTFSKHYIIIPFSRSYAAADLPSHQEIGMPSLSPTMTQGNIAKWQKQEGDQVAAGDVLCEIETDKATLEMESMEEGYLAKILLGDGSKDIQVGQAIAIFVENKEDVAKFKDYQVSDGTPRELPPKEKEPPATTEPKKEVAAEKPPKLEATRPSSTSSSVGRIFASPNARRLAQENNISLANVKGTGPQGRILRADIEEILGPSLAQPSPALSIASLPNLEYIDIPNTQIRRVIAQRLLQSKQTIPHYYLTIDARVDKLLSLREELNATLQASSKASAEGKGKKKLSFNDFVIKAAALALRNVPECNSSWKEEFIRQFHNVNISVAVQTEHGLMVPVVKDADKKGLLTISEDVKTLAEKARTNSLKPADYEGGTFTVSNLGGPFGVKQFCAIINPPQACILAVGTTEKRVTPGTTEGEYGEGTYMCATISCDHRVVDGAIGAQWLGAFKGYIENPVTLLL
ncbi:hypothetical protein O6H91_12G047400 [Diphasiastrum complanatum]|uniref:Uncharacterized protein n=1 Tax=Diphasiastrum complanatum TaxID=34168 RepID=A0ACC2C1C8_DIPCM|nr:hypothetical protein O6H91_12G047400 [Diphasiastrum complanatum]